MDSGALLDRILPLALALMMLGVGITLTRADFARIIAQPRALLAGLSGQLVLLPLLGAALVWAWGLPDALGLGLLILTFAPGGVTSNLITLLARGDTALSVSLTALSSLITPLSLPLLTGLALNLMGSAGAGIDFPILSAILKLVIVTLLPVMIGVALNECCPAACRRLQRSVKWGGLLFFLLTVLIIVQRTWPRLPELLEQLGVVVLLLSVLAMLAGWLLGRIARLGAPQQLTLAVEVGIQNAGTALLVTATLLGNPEMSAAVLIYGVLMQVPALLLILLRNLPFRVRGVALGGR